MSDKRDGHPTNDCCHFQTGEEGYIQADDNDGEYDDDEYNDYVDTGGFEASGIGKPAELSSFHPVEGTQSSFGEFAVCMIDDG